MAKSMSNSDLLKQELTAFSNVRLPINRADNPGGEEIPFIVGAIDDFSGNSPDKPRGELSDRKFDKVSRYTLDEKVAEIAPGVEYDVKPTLPKSIYDGDPLHVRVVFKEMKDFEPRRVAQNIPALLKVQKLRDLLAALRARVAVDPNLAKEIEALVGQMFQKKS